MTHDYRPGQKQPGRPLIFLLPVTVENVFLAKQTMEGYTCALYVSKALVSLRLLNPSATHVRMFLFFFGGGGLHLTQMVILERRKNDFIEGTVPFFGIRNYVSVIEGGEGGFHRVWCGLVRCESVFHTHMRRLHTHKHTSVVLQKMLSYGGFVASDLLFVQGVIVSA